MTKPGLKQRFVRAASWTMVGYFLTSVLRLGSNLILARLLAPEMFGLMAVGILAINALTMFSDMGLVASVIRSPRGTARDYLNTIWVMQIGRGLLISLAAAAMAVLLWVAGGAGLLPNTSVYANPQAPILVAILSVLGLISGLESTRVALARRNMALAGLVKMDVVCQLATTFFIIAWALVSPSVWCLAGGWIFGAALRTCLTHTVLVGERDRLAWDRSAFEEIYKFGKWTFLSSALAFLLNSGDRLLLGTFLDAREMGFYSIAFLLVSSIQTAVVRLVTGAALPMLGEVVRDRPAHLKQTLYRVRKPLTIFCLFSSGAIAMLGQPIVNVLYDSRYVAVGWMLSVLALTLIATPAEVFDQCLVAMGRAKRQSALNFVRLLSLFILVPLGFWEFGIVGGVTAVAIASIVNLAVSLALQARMGLLDVKSELAMLPYFALGLVSGWLARQALA